MPSSRRVYVVCLCFFLSSAAVTADKRRCQLCSDINIETHHGSFFRNPREKQGEQSQPLKCSARARRRLQACEDYCFTLRVTSHQIGANESDLFGESAGCSTSILPSISGVDQLCFRRDVPLQTEPRFVVQAEYCLCKEDYLMHLFTLLLVSLTTVTSAIELKTCNYCASRDFYEQALRFVNRQVINRHTRSKYISTVQCEHFNNLSDIKCTGRCFTMISEYLDAHRVQQRSEVRSCEALHFSPEELTSFNETRCYQRFFQNNAQTICFCGNKKCNEEITTDMVDAITTTSTVRPTLDSSSIVDAPQSSIVDAPQSNIVDAPQSNIIDAHQSSIVDAPKTNVPQLLDSQDGYYNYNQIQRYILASPDKGAQKMAPLLSAAVPVLMAVIITVL
ncbi:hypothetical protein QR680_000980 [Steinernema hermaphroditum]|uniref:Uncharacterized protein n=1 Tax=Steinernema hermaphroditum TaxID=289476 RepID=A0AA39GXE5_9BILA|nr:hypothetical protein QR680_000980 [Steinernema hermaphroditum]